ncbi:MAG: N-acetylglucosamine-6-phosphate deacetylase [Atopobiaceae bacterium]|nr:N-acetylglucosamine-6-phosphate deacetylase [Atopobiaceae bacterium]
MDTFAVKADKFFLPGATSGPGFLIIEDGVFGQFTTQEPDCEIVDCTGSWIAPGLVDTHIHGFLDHDIMDCDADGVIEIAQGLLSNGVTSWLPTTLTASVEQTGDACESVADAAEGIAANGIDAARIQGIFLEGPFFTEKHKGAQNPAYFLDPDVEVFDEWQNRADGWISKIAIAPERNGAPEFCAEMANRGVHVALGHSDATYEQALACVNAGADIFVHTYNGMSGLHHREPGMVGAAMTTHGTYAEAICDGHHLNPIAVRALVEAKGTDHTVLITDCMRAGGMPDGNYNLGDFPVVVSDGTARLTDESHSLAGSILRLFQGLKNVYDWGIVSAEDAIRMASENPARSCGIDDVCGFIRPGYEADFIVLNENLQLLETFLGGKSVYKA